MFINAICEHPNQDTVIRRACQDFQSQMTASIEELATAAEVQNPPNLADTLALLLEGSIVTALVAGKPDSANTARLAAKVSVDNALQAKA